MNRVDSPLVGIGMVPVSTNGQRMKARVFVIFAAIWLLCLPVRGAQDESGKEDENPLPWHMIAEKVGDGADFCWRLCPEEDRAEGDPCWDYAAPPALTFLRLPWLVTDTEENMRETVGLSRWEQDQWVDVPAILERREPNALAIKADGFADAFYRLSVTGERESSAPRNRIAYAIITRTWKKDFLAFCRGAREHIETNPDPQLIYSSIAVSHFHCLMAQVSEAPVLSYELLQALCRAVKAQQTFDANECPELVKERGVTNIKLKRFEGAETATFAVSLPYDYDESQKYPMHLLIAGGFEPDHINGTGRIQLGWGLAPPTGDRPPIDHQWSDYTYMLEVLADRISIDYDRVYVHGWCTHGIAAVELGLNYPDRWAECSAALGNASRHLAGNALNLPFIYIRGGHDQNPLVAYYYFAVECFKYHNCRLFKYSDVLGIDAIRGRSELIRVRDRNPHRVSYTIESLANPQAYWIRIDGREDENFLASIDAIAWGQSIMLKTSNVDAYTLDLELAPLDHEKPVEIMENGERVASVTGPVFVRKSEKYSGAVWVKDQSLRGPVSHVFNNRYAVVWTDGEGDEGTNETIAKALAGSGPCFADRDLPGEFAGTHNIVLVGKPQESQHFGGIADELPVKITGDKLLAEGLTYQGDVGLILIYPNPDNRKRYVAVFSGMSARARAHMTTAWSQMQAKGNNDVGIFKIGDDGEIEWPRLEKFNTVWGWHGQWGVPLAQLSKSHPKWRWRQWVARTLRKQLAADVTISEEVFESAEAPAAGAINLRDLSRIFKNEWIVKLRFKGKDIRSILTGPLIPGLSPEGIQAPITDGVRFGPRPSDGHEDALYIGDVEDEQWYTIALPYKAVNGVRMNRVLANYTIVGEGRLVTLLNKYLRSEDNKDLDAELDDIKASIF